ncbi:unnamed protein product (macronuclear) [Paramecium tetraurelia]|uniref:Uncharacterized protein n=1 Tax=Paramecium tetraurelia TaxID=5888 RepID=A0CWW9_PARTE|nr:uncharacterized protein GSPATT00001489001 [Paramecium tetraurelia]CAK75286.1 unnamed protein product [Paramecium tetraurelia]|eukprot:XP_001442683.1 hypothetical protein (macronuclear) [Paramecium tetraurelia strain d4-2]
MHNLPSISNAIKKFNVYTRPVSLLLLKEQGHRTYLGVFLTSILVSLVVLVYYSGLESLIVRNNPSAISYTTYSEDQKPFYLAPQNFSIAIAQKGNDLMASYILEGSIGQTDGLTIQEIPMSKCIDFQFDDPTLNAYFDKSDQIWYCIDWKFLTSIVLEGGLESSKDKSLQIKVKQCTSASTQCIAPNIMDSDQFLLKMTSANTDISNFKKPVNLIGKSFVLTSLLNFTKKLNIILQPQLTQTDNGYIVQDQYEETMLSISNYYETIQDKSSDQQIFQINISLDQKTFITQRSYPRVYQYLGDIGGFWEIIYLCSLLFIMPFNNLSYRVSLLNELFNFEMDYDNKVHPDNKGKAKVREILNKSVQLEKFNRMSKVAEHDANQKSKLLDQISSDITQFFKEQESRLDLQFFDYFGCCQCKKGGKRELINFSMGKITHTLDITYIIKKLQEIDKLKLILLSSDQIKLFDYLPKPKLGLHMKASENEYCSILKPEQSDLDKALEAQKAFQQLQDQDDEITPKLVKLLDEDLVALFKLQLNKGVNRSLKKTGQLADAVQQLMIMNAKEKEIEKTSKKKKKKNKESSNSENSESSGSEN